MLEAQGEQNRQECMPVGDDEQVNHNQVMTHYLKSHKGGKMGLRDIFCEENKKNSITLEQF